jgi:ataxia telangiectasia mutated family protein
VYVDRKVQEIQQRKEEMLKLASRRDMKEYNTLDNYQKKATALLAADEESSRRHNVARDAFLKQAMDMYSRCLEASDTFDNDSAIRLCSLWFANFDDIHLQDKAREALDRVPSRKFIFLAHQISARLATLQSAHNQKSQENLQHLVVKMCQEHPFHSLYQVYCLRPDHSSMASAHSSRQSARHVSPASQTDRATAAGHIFDRLRNDPSSKERVRAIEQVCDASLQWAKYPIKEDDRYKKPRVPFQVPNGLLISKIASLKVPVITMHTPLDPTLRYDSCVWIERYDHTFETAGGLNLPKISICHGSDGGKYKQLVRARYYAILLLNSQSVGTVQG